MKKKFESLQEMFRVKSRWHQRSMTRRNAKGEVVAWCLVGGCDEVYDNISKRCQVFNELLHTIKKMYPRSHSVVSFNDNRNRNIQQIRKVVKEAGV